MLKCIDTRSSGMCVCAIVGALCFGAFMSGAQTLTVRGTVLDTRTGFPVDGAVITVTDPADTSVRAMALADLIGAWSVSITTTGIADGAGMPGVLRLEPNYPNPFNPSTTIRFSIPAAGPVRLLVHNILGQEIGRREAVLGPGSYDIEWNSVGAAGVLVYSIESNGRREVRKMTQLDGGSGGGLGEFRHIGPPSATAVRAGPETSEFRVVAERFDYMPDTLVVPAMDNVRADFLLTTVHDAAVVVDLHNDVLEKVVGGYDLGSRHTYNHTDIPRLRDGGVDVQAFVAWPNPSQYPTTSFAQTNAMLDAFEAERTSNPADLAPVRNTGEIDSVLAIGSIGAFLVVEGGHAIEDDIGKLIALYQRGARYLTITWNNSTSWAVAAADSRSATVGLSDFGRQVIRTMDSLGMIIDVSHTGIKTIEDILAVTTNPIIASHSGARALRDHYRNLTDNQIRSIAQTGGVIGVVFYPPFLSSGGPVTVENVLYHINHIRGLVGVDHIALGSDYDGIGSVPVGLEDVSRFPALTRRLLETGYSREEVFKILGGNALRVIRQVCH